MNELDKYEKNCIISALEIAKLVLAEDVGQTWPLTLARESCLKHLDISDEEAEILQEKIDILLGEG